jgi:hypothetical protein
LPQEQGEKVTIQGGFAAVANRDAHERPRSRRHRSLLGHY